MVGGLIEVDGRLLYESSINDSQMRLDKVVHFFGFVFSTLVGYEVARKVARPDAPAKSLAVIAFFVGLGVGAVNETIEFVITLLPQESNVGGFSNTGWDLVANACGAGVAALLAPRLDMTSRP